MGDGGSPPFGARGYVVAVHGEACEVLFDREFVGGTDLHGVLPDKRGVLLPGAELVNLSHPPAMPLLGDAAPDRVVADKKGRVTKGGWDEKSARRKDAGGESAARPEPGGPRVPKGILAIAAALLPGKAGLPAGPGGQPRQPVPGSRGFAAGAGRGRGAPPRGASCPRAGQAHARRHRRIGGARRGARAGPRRHAGGCQPQEHAHDRRWRRRGRRRRSRRRRVALADLGQRMSGAAVSTAPAAPGPDDPAAFWTMLAGGAPAAPRFGGAAAPKPRG